MKKFIFVLICCFVLMLGVIYASDEAVVIKNAPDYKIYCNGENIAIVSNLKKDEALTKNLIINITREEKFKELKIVFTKDEKENQTICQYFGYAEFPYINFPTDNCFYIEKDEKIISISYPFEKINENNEQKTYLKDDSYLLIFSFQIKNTKTKLIQIKKEIYPEIDSKPVFFNNENHQSQYQLKAT